MEIGLGTKIWEKVTQLSFDLFCTINREGTFIQVSESSFDILGYLNEDLIGSHYSHIVFPDDLAITQETTAEVLNGSSKKNFENHLVHKSGKLVSILWSAVWSEEDQLIYCVGRDVTETKKNRRVLRKSEKKYKTLFNDNPDLIYLENYDGLITEVNQSFCNILGVAMEDAVNNTANTFLPSEMETVSTAALQQALLGNTIRFDLELITGNNERRIYDAIKQPIIIDGEVDCVQTIAKDITPMVRSYNTIQQQAQKLNTIFESITDCFVMLDRNWNFAYINKAAEELLCMNPDYYLGKNVWQEIPEIVNGEIYNNYHQAVATGKSVHFETYYQAVSLWLEITAFPSEEGLSIYFNDISELVRSRQELEKMSLVASRTTNSVIIMDAQSRIEWVNNSFINLTGYTLEEALGLKPFEVLGGPETDQEKINYMLDKVSKGESYIAEVLYYKKSGEKVWLHIEGTPVFDEHGKVIKRISVHTDVTERIKSHLELTKLSLVASKTNNSVLIADKDWRIEWVNEGFIKLMGYTLQEASGKRPSQLLHNHKTNRKTYELLEPKLLQGEPISFEVLNVKKSGEEVWVNVEISPILDDKGAICQFVEVQTDITALQKSKIELSTLAKDLYSRNSDLQQFTYIVSHNLRSPVANTLGLANLLITTNKNSELYETLLTNLQQSVRQIDTVLNDMNTILSIRDSKHNIEQEAVNVSEVFEQALLSLQKQVEKSGGQIKNEIPANLAVKAYKAYVYSIFYNLLSNAIKYRSEERPLQVQVRCLENSDKGALLSFSDNGSGFDLAKAKNQVFKLYKRFHTNKKGSGIGLYLIKTHLEVMGGHIEVNSEVGKGTEFQIYLPKI